MMLHTLRAMAIASCVCNDTSLCAPIASALPRIEIFGFMASAANASHFDWSSGVTSVAWNLDAQFVCKAHAHGVRVIAPHGVASGGFNITELGESASKRAAWIDALVAYIAANHLDGVTFDYESPLAEGAPEVAWYAQIVKETTKALRARVAPTTQSSVCAAWSPDCIDGRCYDYGALAEASDFLYVMGYDTRSQIFDACTAYANAALPLMQRGVARYLESGVAPEKLVLGTPWYGCTSPLLRARRGRRSGGDAAVAVAPAIAAPPLSAEARVCPRSVLTRRARRHPSRMAPSPPPPS
jgi:di-N-acetylchitobiase